MDCQNSINDVFDENGNEMSPLDDEEDDYCFECSGYGDDYYISDDGDLVCRCPECIMNQDNDYWDE